MKLNIEWNLMRNTFLLYIMTAAKLILPLITLPYLTRVLSTDTYGIVVYVKSCMSYVQLFIDFGFILSATKDVVNIASKYEGKRKEKILIGRVIGDTFVEKGILALCSAIFLIFMALFIPILSKNIMFLWLYFFSYVITIFLADFLFRGLEKMEMVTIPFVVSKVISTFLTIILVKNDQTIIYIPILEILGNLVAVFITLIYIKKLGYIISISHPKYWFDKLKESFVYFISNFATTAFGALLTLLVGIFLTPSDVAFWGVAMQLTSAVQQMYSPIMNSLYPYMIKTKSRKMIRKILIVFMPIVLIGCIFCELTAKWIILIISGAKYIKAVSVFRMLVPVLFLSFPAMLFGWPVLGAINKAKETTISTIIAAVVQLVCLLLLVLTGNFNLVGLAVGRGVSECSMFAMRYYYYKKYYSEFLD